MHLKNRVRALALVELRLMIAIIGVRIALIACRRAHAAGAALRTANNRPPQRRESLRRYRSAIVRRRSSLRPIWYASAVW